MKFLAHFSRIFVGIIFIFSGLIKLNDPVGTEIKLEEYFDVFATDFPAMAGFWHFWVPYALYVSIFLCALELVLGVCLLVQYKLRRVGLFQTCRKCTDRVVVRATLKARKDSKVDLVL